MFSQISQMTRQVRHLRKLKRQIEALESEGSAGGGMVRIRVGGTRNVRRVSIDPKIVQGGDVELLEDLVKAAMNDALRRLEKQAAEHPALQELGELAQGS